MQEGTAWFCFLLFSFPCHCCCVICSFNYDFIFPLQKIKVGLQFEDNPSGRIYSSRSSGNCWLQGASRGAQEPVLEPTWFSSPSATAAGTQHGLSKPAADTEQGDLSDVRGILRTLRVGTKKPLSHSIRSIKSCICGSQLRLGTRGWAPLCRGAAEDTRTDGTAEGSFLRMGQGQAPGRSPASGAGQSPCHLDPVPATALT